MLNKLEHTFLKGSGYKLLLACILFMGLAIGLYKGVLDNFLAEIVGMSEYDRGVTEFFRELPGLALVFILAALYMLSAEGIYKIGAVIVLAGMCMVSAVPPQKVLFVFAMCMVSLGQHIQLGMQNSLTLEYSQQGKGGSGLGILSSVNNIGTLIGYFVIVLCFTATASYDQYRMVFIASAVLTAIAVVSALGLKGNSTADASKRRFYFRKKYTKYYMLEVFYGARKQVFFTFGPYVLILIYGASAKVLSFLFAISAVSCFLLAPLVGKLIDKAGYKIVMIMDTLILVIVCFFYGFAHHLFPKNIAFIVCCINYILDSIISLASLASNVYVQDLADSQDEVRATLSTGISVNHLITVLIALFGGWIWQKLGVETLFILSAILGLCNSAYAATIKTNKKV